APAAARQRVAPKQSDRPAVETASIATLRDEHARFDRLRDPDGYLRGGVKAWAETLAANPVADAADPALSIATVGDLVVGRLGFVAATIQRRGVTEPALSLDGFYVSDGCKRTGIGATLLLSALETRRCLIASGAPSPEAKGLYERVGFKELGPLRRFLHVNRPDPIAHRLLGEGKLATAAAIAVRPIVGGHNWWLTKRLRRTNHQVTKSRAVGDWDFSCGTEEPCEGGFPITLDQWRWVASKRDLVRIEIRDADKLVAWAVVGGSRMRLAGTVGPWSRTARLLDYDADDDVARRALVAYLIEHVSREQFDLLEMQVGDSAMATLCRRCRMIEKGGNCVMVRPSKRGTDDTALDWQLRLASGDVLINF
ncbi:MAG: hypothetical protein AAF266_16125, partial [Planctomycetota bacterium]